MGRYGEIWGDMDSILWRYGTLTAAADSSAYVRRLLQPSPTSCALRWFIRRVPRPATYRTTQGPESALDSALWRYGTRRVPRPRTCVVSQECSDRRGVGGRETGDDGTLGANAQTHTSSQDTPPAELPHPRAHSPGDVATIHAGTGGRRELTLTDAVNSAQSEADGATGERGSGNNKRTREETRGRGGGPRAPGSRSGPRRR